MKKIAIIGHGYVGKAMALYFRDHFPLVVSDQSYQALKDIMENASDWQNTGHEHTATYAVNPSDAVNQCDLAVICVPTPMDHGTGECDTSIVEKVLEWIRTPLVLIKSTVTPGTTRKLQEKYPHLKIAFSPEYIGEGKYHVPTHKGYPHPTDMKQHEFFIFGGERETTGSIIPFFLKVSGPDAKYMQTDSITAELVKYMENSWGATKVTFCNEFYEIAQAMGVDYSELRELLLLDGRMERMHTAVFPEARGFGGKCFPKDVNAIVAAAKVHGVRARLLEEVLSRNDEFRALNKHE